MFTTDSGTQSAGSRRRLGHGFIDAGSDSTGQLILKSGRSGATFSTSSSTNFVGFHEQGLIKHNDFEAPIAWHGRLVQREQAAPSIASHSLHLGIGVFDGIATGTAITITFIV